MEAVRDTVSGTLFRSRESTLGIRSHPAASIYFSKQTLKIDFVANLKLLM